MKIMDGVTWGYLCLKINVNCGQWEIFENYWPFFVSLCCSLLTQVLINSIGSIIFLLQQLTKKSRANSGNNCVESLQGKSESDNTYKTLQWFALDFFKDWIFSLFTPLKASKPELSEREEKFHFSHGELLKKREILLRKMQILGYLCV